MLVASAGSPASLLLWRVPHPRRHGSGPGIGAPVSVVIPARNEARNLPAPAGVARGPGPSRRSRCWWSTTAPPTPPPTSPGPPARACVEPRPPPPDGWLGKPWACHPARGRGPGERLLFLDADTWLAPDGARPPGRRPRRRWPDGLLSVQPYHVVERPYEQLSAVCNIVPVLASGMAGRPAPPLRSGGVRPVPPRPGRRPGRGRGLRDRGRARSWRTPRWRAPTRAAGRPVRCLGGGDDGALPHVPRRARRRSWPRGGRRTSPAARRGCAWLPLLGAVAVGERRAGRHRRRRTEPVGGVGGGLHRLSRRSSGGCCAASARSTRLTAVLFPIPLLAFAASFVWSLAARVLARRPVTWRGAPSTSAAAPSVMAAAPRRPVGFWGTARRQRRRRGRWSTPAPATSPTGSRPSGCERDGWLLRVRPFEPAGVYRAARGSDAGRTASPRPVRSSPAASASAGCPATRSSAFVRRDPPRRVRATGWARWPSPRVRPLEPAARRRPHGRPTASSSTPRSSPSSATTAPRPNGSSPRRAAGSRRGRQAPRRTVRSTGERRGRAGRSTVRGSDGAARGRRGRSMP